MTYSLVQVMIENILFMFKKKVHLVMSNLFTEESVIILRKYLNEN